MKVSNSYMAFLTFVYLLHILTFAFCFDGEWLKTADEAIFPKNCVKANLGDSYVVFSDYGDCTTHADCAAFGHAYNVSLINRVYAYFAYAGEEIGTKYDIKPHQYDLLQYTHDATKNGYEYSWVKFEEFMQNPGKCDPVERSGWWAVNFNVEGEEWMVGKYSKEYGKAFFVRDGHVFEYDEEALDYGYLLCTTYVGRRELVLESVNEVSEDMFSETAAYVIFGSFENSGAESKRNIIARDYIERWGEDYGFHEDWREALETNFEGTFKISKSIYGKVWNGVHGAYSTGDTKIREAIKTYSQEVSIPSHSTISFSVVIYYGTLEIPYRGRETVYANNGNKVFERDLEGKWVGHTTYIGELFLGAPIRNDLENSSVV